MDTQQQPQIIFNAPYYNYGGTMTGNVTNYNYGTHSARTTHAEAEEVAYEECGDKEEEPEPSSQDIAVSPRIPKELLSRRAKALLDIAVHYGVLTADYQKAKETTVWQLAFVADKIGKLLEVPNKWVLFAGLWNIDAKHLRNEHTRVESTEQGNNFMKKVVNKIH